VEPKFTRSAYPNDREDRRQYGTAKPVTTYWQEFFQRNQCTADFRSRIVDIAD